MSRLIHSCRRQHDFLLAQFLPSGVDRHSEEADGIAMLVNLALLAFPLIICFVAKFAYFGIWELAISLSAAGAVMIGSPWIYKMTGSRAIARESFLISLFAFKLFESIFFASVASPGVIWFLTMPMAGILLGSIPSGISWLAVSTSSMLLLHYFYHGNIAFIGTASNSAFLYTFSLVFLGFTFFAFVLMVDASRKKALQRLKDANHTIHELAIRDPLTGIFNRRYVWEQIQREELRALSNSSTFYICLIDLDRFKQINDIFGHMVGDIVLQAVATAIEGEVRQEDCFGRYGGEEFILMLKSRSTFNPEALAERIRRRVAGLRINEVPNLKQITVSIGIAEFQQSESFSKTISRADKALYAAKTLGRNRIVFANTEDIELMSA